MLHPSLTLLFIFMIFASFVEVNGDGYSKKNRFLLWIAGIGLIILGGLRNWVGADYPVYLEMYYHWLQIAPWQDVTDKLLFRDSQQEIEALYIVLNKLLFSFAAPFHIFTLVVAVIVIGLKMFVYNKNSPYPVFSLLLIFIPVFFTTDSGQMRQALAMVLCYYSYEYIKNRNFWMFLLMVYLAMQFHKSAVIFIPAYWIVNISLNSTRIAVMILISVLLSPLKIYLLFPGLIESFTPKDVAAGYTGYVELEEQTSVFMDMMMLMFATFIVTYNKEACSRVWYYEYMRNIVVFGICLYFIFRSNPAFATRLVGMYTTFSAMLIPSIAYALSKTQRKMMHIYFVIFMIFYYFVFAKYQGLAGRWTPETYSNFLW